MKSFVLPFLLFFVFANSQNLDQYKYAIVKSKFDCQSKANEYRLNNLAKAFLQKYNFEVYLDTDNYPEQLANNNCDAIFVDVEDHSGMMKTKVNVVVRNCRNEIIYTSPEGVSNKKSYSLAYDAAVREAFGYATVLKDHKVAAQIDKPFIPTNSIPSTANENETTSDYEVVKLTDGYSIESPLLKTSIRLLKTSNPKSFIAKFQDMTGTATVKDGYILLEYYDGGELKKARVTVTLD